ncbi:MAG TPA: hypothetical protein VGR97_02465 [Candidatus Acidoferrales bacterium]|nr:hypothetical protein [Candidatus Acidoferrales bacterium]
MNRCLLALTIQVFLISGCAKPDRVDRTNSPMAGLFITVETHYGRGAPAADFTRIYAHLEADGKADKELMLDGEYLQGTKLIWLDPHEVTLCVPEGYTESFRNYVTLHAGGVTQTVHAHIQEHCGP